MSGPKQNDRGDKALGLDQSMDRRDFLNSTFHGFQQYARQFAARRDPESGKPMLRFYAIESTPTLTGMKADHRLALKASEIAAAAQGLSGGSGSGTFSNSLAQKFIGDRPIQPCDMGSGLAKNLIECVVVETITIAHDGF